MQFSTLTLHTSDGLALHGDLAVPERCRGAAVVCHPHPLYGGNRLNPVVTAIARALHDAGLATVRFDFRGVGASEGTHGGGTDERLDVLSALEAARAQFGTGPLVLAGYSFGSMVALDVDHASVTAWLAVAPPLGVMGGTPASATDSRAKHLLVPEHDQYSPPATAAGHSSAWVNTTMVTVPMADHFLAGHSSAVTELATAFVSALA